MKENKLYWKYALIIVVITLGVIIFFKMIPYLSGILGAFTIYVLLRKQLVYLTEKKRMKRTLAAVFLLIETILLFLIPLSLLAWMLLDKVDGISIDQSALVSSTEHITDLIHQKTGYNVLSENNLSAIVNFLTQVGQALVSSFGSFVMNLFILIFVLFFMLSGGNKMEKYVYSLLPFSDKNKTYVLKEIYNIVKANALGIPLLAVIQGGIAMAGYFIFGVPNAFFWGVITCFTTIIPIVGTALVWVPLSIYFALLGSWPQAIGLLAYTSIIVTNVDNLIRFMLQKQMADTHPLVTVFGVFIGLSLFGFMGVIFGPLLLSFFALCVDICKREYLD